MCVRRCATAGFLLVLLTVVTDGAAARTCDELSAATAQGHPTRPGQSADSSGGADQSTPPAARRFWVRDSAHYRSDWYAGKHRKMVPFGCTRAPYYAPDPRCSNDRGFHHGLDIAMPCGTPLYAGLRGRVVKPTSAGSLGSAYGTYAFRLRNSRSSVDIVIGHVRKVYVRPGDHVNRGRLVALASDQGAPDGCHLHFEVRPAGGQYDAAVAPGSYLRLHRVG